MEVCGLELSINTYSYYSINKDHADKVRMNWQSYTSNPTYWTPSTKAVSSRVCNQLNIIMFLSYLERGFPLSLSTSLIVKGKFLPALDLAALNMAALVLLEVVGLLLGVGLEPGTVSLVGP